MVSKSVKVSVKPAVEKSTIKGTVSIRAAPTLTPKICAKQAAAAVPEPVAIIAAKPRQTKTAAAKKTTVPVKPSTKMQQHQMEEDEDEIDESVLAEFAADFRDNEFGSDSDEFVDDDEEEEGEEQDGDITIEIESGDEVEEEGNDDDDYESNNILEGIDSSDEEEDENGADGFSNNDSIVPISKSSSKISSTPKLVSKSKKAHSTTNSSSSPGVIYLGRIPHGFYEAEMRAYFKQFGEVSRLRLSRNKKTGASKHYAFIEFKDMEVAKIVAETMDGYLLYSHVLKCKLVPQEKLHPKTFDGANKNFKVIPWQKLDRFKRSKPKTPEQVQKLTAKLALKDRKKKKALVAKGIDYEFQGYSQN